MSDGNRSAPPPRPSTKMFPSEPPGRRVKIAEEESGLYRIVSEDGEVGAVFTSRTAARRFAEREFRVAQGREVVDETHGHSPVPPPARRR